MELKTQQLKIFNGSSRFSDREDKVITAEVIEKLSVNLKGYPQFSVDKLCLCKDKYCKELDLELNATLNIDRSELFMLLGAINKQDAVADVFESLNEDENIDKAGGSIPIKMTFELDIKKMIKRSEKLKELQKEQEKELNETQKQGDQ